MKTRIYFILLLSFLSCLSVGSGYGNPSSKKQKKDKGAIFTFVPNQLAGNWWYKPGGSLINGHLDESFGNAALWPMLRENLKKTGGAFSLFAAEIVHLSTKAGLLAILEKEQIPVSVELPGFTQCIPGIILGETELNGKPIHTPGGLYGNDPRFKAPDGHGWFYTKDCRHFIPNEILFDERQPNLCPEFDAKILADTKGTWEERKTAAKINRGCEVSMLSWDQLLPALRKDYVDFLNIAKEKWGDKMPDVGIHWNVVAGWEWRDQKALDDIHAADPHYFDTAENFYAMVRNCPQYNSVQYCNQLIDTLTAAGFKPKTILMDVDWTYDIPYITEVLKRHKTELKARGVQMGINIVEASLRDNEELYYDGVTLQKRAVADGDPNVLYENTLIAIMKFLKGSGIYEKGMQMRVGSWSHRPYETWHKVDEMKPGSIAHTANEIFKML